MAISLGIYPTFSDKPTWFEYTQHFQTNQHGFLSILLQMPWFFCAIVASSPWLIGNRQRLRRSLTAAPGKVEDPDRCEVDGGFLTWGVSLNQPFF